MGSGLLPLVQGRKGRRGGAMGRRGLLHLLHEGGRGCSCDRAAAADAASLGPHPDLIWRSGRRVCGLSVLLDVVIQHAFAPLEMVGGLSDESIETAHVAALVLESGHWQHYGVGESAEDALDRRPLDIGPLVVVAPLLAKRLRVHNFEFPPPARPHDDGLLILVDEQLEHEEPQRLLPVGVVCLQLRVDDQPPVPLAVEGSTARAFSRLVLLQLRLLQGLQLLLPRLHNLARRLRAAAAEATAAARAAV